MMCVRVCMYILYIRNYMLYMYIYIKSRQIKITTRSGNLCIMYVFNVHMYVYTYIRTCIHIYMCVSYI